MMKYSNAVKEFIEKNVNGTTTRNLVKLVNAEFGTDFTEAKMKSYKTNNKLKSGTLCGLPAGRPTELYPEKIRKFIGDNHVGIGPKGMAELLNKTFDTSYTKIQMKSYYGNHNIDSGLKGYFNKGHIPENKGRKGYHAPGSEKGWFKKGDAPINHKIIGSERVDTDGYTLIKTAEPNVWKLKHKVLWEEKNGEVPEGCVVTFLDGNKGNITLENLALISMAESLELTRSSLRYKNAELTKTGILVVKVKKACMRKAVKGNA